MTTIDNSFTGSPKDAAIAQLRQQLAIDQARKLIEVLSVLPYDVAATFLAMLSREALKLYSNAFVEDE